MLDQFKNALRLELNWDHFRNATLTLAGLSLIFFVLQAMFVLFTYLLPFKSGTAEVQIPDMKASAVMPIDQFQQKISKRNLFFEPTKAAAPVVQTPEGLHEKAAKLTLIGVVLTGTPEAIVKDSVSSETHFLRKGEKILGLDVKEIKKGSIILKLGDQEKEIFLA